MLYEEFEDSKGVTRIRKSKDRQYNISYFVFILCTFEGTMYTIQYIWFIISNLRGIRV